MTDPLTALSVAVMVVDPGAIPFTKGLWGGIVATSCSDDVQVTFVLMFRVPPSLNNPIAVN